MKLSNKKGVSIIELIAIIAIGGIVTLTIFSLISVTTTASNRNNLQNELISESKLLELKIDDLLSDYNPQDFTICGATCVDANNGTSYILNPDGTYNEVIDSKSIRIEYIDTYLKIDSKKHNLVSTFVISSFEVGTNPTGVLIKYTLSTEGNEITYSSVYKYEVV